MIRTGYRPPKTLHHLRKKILPLSGAGRNLFMRSVHNSGSQKFCPFRFDHSFYVRARVLFPFNRYTALISSQLFENQSVVEYWENFASHAFESTTQSVVSHCVLLKPNGAPVPCTFCFSIRRDIMDLPSIIIGEYFPTQRPAIFQVSHQARFTIGQWLPLL